MMALARGKEALDLTGNIIRPVRPNSTHLLRQAGESSPPIGEQAVISHNRARPAARGGFRVEHMTQPEQASLPARHAVTALERLDNLQRVAEHEDAARVDPRVFKRL